VFSWLHDHDGHVALAQVLVWAGLIGVAGPALLRAWRDLDATLRWRLVFIGLAATGLSVFGFPLGRYDALGHSASYYECYLGAQTPSNAAGWEAFVTYPLLRWSYWAIGGLVGRDSGPVPLIVLNALASGLGVLAFGWLVAVLMRSGRAATAAAVLLALHPVHAFWGAATFNVSLPHAGIVLCVLLSVIAWGRGDWRLLAAAAATGGLVVALRVEWGLLGPALLLLLLALGKAWGRADGVWGPRFWGPGIAVAVAYFLTTIPASGGSLAEQGGYHGVSGYLETVGRQIFFFEVFAPWHLPWMAALVALGLGVAARPDRLGSRGALGLVGFAVVAHLGMSTFNDSAYRHALLPSLTVIAAASAAADLVVDSSRVWLRGLAGALLAAAVVTTSLGVLQGRDRYFAEPEQFFESVAGFRGDELAAADIESGECYLVTDDERLWGMGLAGSHFNLMDPGEAVMHYRDHGGCILWLYDRSQWRWDGVAARARAAKMLYWFDWEEQGWVELDEGLLAVVYRMASPPWGIADDEPLPDSEFFRSREGE